MALKSVMLLTLAVLGGLVCPRQPTAGTELSGAGATFPYPYYQTVFEAFSRQHSVAVRYQATGSGEGIRSLLDRKADFGATDAFMTPEEIRSAPAPIVHVPTCLGAVVLTYYLPGNPALRLSADVVADIFLGRIVRWNDPRIGALNPDQRLPDLPVRVAHRSDSSGTTFIFSEYLTKTNPAWRAKVGTGKTVKWPVGIGGKGNPGVAGLVKQAPGSIGYVELIYALGNDLTVASLRNRAGRFVEPVPDTVTLAARVPLPDDTNASLTDTEVPEGYPISSFTWVGLYQEQDYDGRSRERSEALVRLLWWVTHEGQAYARPLHYAPLPHEAVRKAENLLRSVTYRGQPILR
jgi:phosphate transport system substrate-binding protein